MFTPPGDHPPSVSLLYLPRKLLVDIGFEGLINKMEEHAGKRFTLAVTVMVGLAAITQGLRLSIEALIWVFRAIRTSGESVGLMNLQDWAALALTVGMGVTAVFVIFVIFDRLWITKRVNATRHDVERMLHEADASVKQQHDEILAIVNQVQADHTEVKARQAALLRRFDESSS